MRVSYSVLMVRVKMVAYSRNIEEIFEVSERYPECPVVFVCKLDLLLGVLRPLV